MELPRDAGAEHKARGRVIRWFGRMAESISLKPCGFRHTEMIAKRASGTMKSERGFGQQQGTAENVRVGLYARVSTHDQKTRSPQARAMREYAGKRCWTIQSGQRDRFRSA